MEPDPNLDSVGSLDPDPQHCQLCKRIGSTFLFFVVTFSIKSQLFLKNPSLFHENRTVSKERVDSQNGGLGRYYGDFHLIILKKALENKSDDLVDLLP